MTKRITVERGPLHVTPERYEDTLFAGLRTEWLSGLDENGVDFTVDCGAGLGGPYMILTLRQEGQPTIHETIDIRPLVEAWVNSALAATPKVGT